MNSAVGLRRDSPARRPRVGFLGLGWIGRDRLKALADSDLVEIDALAEPDPTARQLASTIVPGAATLADQSELLDRNLDGVVIATPSALHAAQSVAALDKGCAVFCQKPLARNGDETRQVISAARNADRLLGIDLSYRFTSGMQAIRELIANGDLGEIHAIHGCFHNAYGPDKNWFYDATLSGGGCLVDLGIHLVDLTLWCLNFPELQRVAGYCSVGGRPFFSQQDGKAASPAPRVVEDYAAAQLEFHKGTVAQLSCSWKAPAGCDARIEFTCFGTLGGATFRNIGGSFYDFEAEHFGLDRSRRPLTSPPDAWGGRAIVSWARQLQQSRRFDPAMDQMSAVSDALDAIYRSAGEVR